MQNSRVHNIFSKFTVNTCVKVSVKGSLFDKVDRVIFTLFFLKAITGRNFTVKGLQHGLFPSDFEKFLRFLRKHPQANTFVPFRPLGDFTNVFKTVTVFLLLHCRSCPCASLRKQQSFDILNKQKPFTISGLESILDFCFYAISRKILIRSSPENDRVY